MNDLVSAQTLRVVCQIAGVLGVAGGLGLLIVPRPMLREGTRLWRWVFEIDLIQLLNSRRWIERPVYRHHKAFGATVIAATLTFLVVSLRELYSDPRLIHWMSERLGSAGARVAIVTV
ncbi:MAG TPA: hypothetical protein VGP71_13235, partial [Burkholderiales bacterium]|nr:hypothetical protein [Burkholderiales bacterium]